MYKLIQLKAAYQLKKKVLSEIYDQYIRSLTLDYLIKYKLSKDINGFLGVLLSIAHKKYKFLKLLENTYLSKVITHLNTLNNNNLNYYINYYNTVCTYFKYLHLYFEKKYISNEVDLHSSINKVLSISFYTVYILYKRMLVQNGALSIPVISIPVIRRNQLTNVHAYYYIIRTFQNSNRAQSSYDVNRVTTLFSMSEFGPNVVDRVNLIYKTRSNHICFIQNSIKVNKYYYSSSYYRYLYMYLMAIYNGHYFSSYEWLLRHEEWILFGVYKKEVIKYHLK